MYQPFLRSGKPVFDIEFTSFSNAQCSQASGYGIGLLYESQQFDGSTYQSCP